MNTQATDFWKNLGHARLGRTPPIGIAQAQRAAASVPAPGPAPAGWLAAEDADAPTPDLSLIVPVHNEEAAIGSFLEALAQVSPDLPSLEIMFVDDGSADNTEMAIRFAMRHDLRIRLLSLSRNFGKEAALCAGLDHATGAACVPMDVDLQDPPELLPQMVEQWRAGAQVVNARRVSRTGDGWLKRATARGFYRLYNALAERPIPEDVGDFRLLDREVVDVLKQLGERQRFNKGLFSWVG
ncbi:MAG: glycosyltransferase, partial [Pseudomonadota bacterium]